MERALLMALNHCSTAKEGTRPPCLLPLGDRPILFHVIEELVDFGITKLELVLYDIPEEIRELVGDGTRWGVQISIHTAKERSNPLKPLLPLIEKWEDATLLFGDASEWIALSFLTCSEKKQRCRFFRHDNKPTRWAILSPRDLNPQAVVPQKLPTVSVESLSIDSLSSFFDTTTQLLNDALPEQRKPHIKEVEPTVWIGRSVMIHSEVNITPPVYIGPNTRIHAEAQIGPYAFIEGDAIIDRSSSISNSAVLRYSFVGEGLEINNCVVDRHWIFKKESKSLIAVTDPYLFNDLSINIFYKILHRCTNQIISGIVLFATFPILLYLLTRYGLKRRPVVHLPTADEPTVWREFDWIELKNGDTSSFNWLPRLLNVLKGNGQIVGVSPRSHEELKNLSEDWRKQILSTPVGAITPQEALAISTDDPMQDFIAESYYAAHPGLWNDLKLIYRLLCTSSFKFNPCVTTRKR